MGGWVGCWVWGTAAVFRSELSHNRPQVSALCLPPVWYGECLAAAAHPPPVASWLVEPCRNAREVTEGRVRPCSGVRRRFCRSLNACASCTSEEQRGRGGSSGREGRDVGCDGEASGHGCIYQHAHPTLPPTTHSQHACTVTTGEWKGSPVVPSVRAGTRASQTISAPSRAPVKDSGRDRQCW